MKNISVNTEEIGKRIRKKRKAMYMTIADIKEQTAIAPATLSEIERGNIAPSCLTLLRLAEIFECTTDWILKGSEETSPRPQHTNLTNKELQLIDTYRILGEKDQLEIDEFIQIKLRLNK